MAACSTKLLTDYGPRHCRAAKGVGKKMTAALESLKVGWGGGSGAASPSSGPATPKGAQFQGLRVTVGNALCNELHTPVLAILGSCIQCLQCTAGIEYRALHG